MGNLYQCGRIAVLCALASIRRFKAASRALWAGWYCDMGRTSKRRETALKTIDGEAPYKPARNAGNVPGSSALASGLIPSALLRRLAGCRLFVRFLEYAEQTRQNGDKPPTPSRLIPPAMRGG